MPDSGENTVTDERLFGTAYRTPSPSTTLHAVGSVIEGVGPRAACSVNLALAHTQPYDEHDGWRICRHAACRRVQREIREARNA